MFNYNYRIYQQKYMFEEFQQVWEGTIEKESEEEALEELFRIFNIEHPEGYRGRSLSVGDVVKIENTLIGVGTTYFCARVGWQKF